MKLEHLYIQNYKNLTDFEVCFDSTESTTILLGRNGSGKSNIIEAIVEIFRDLELKQEPLFSYLLRYICRDNTIEIDSDPHRKNKRIEIKVNGERVSKSIFNKNIEQYLPSYVFSYYSGWSPRLERHFDKPTRDYYSRILKSSDQDMPLRRMFFCRKEYSQLVLLAFFLTDSREARKLLEKYLGIKKFNSALFVLNRPWWGKKKPSKSLEQSDPRFWFAKGAFQGFLSKLWRSSLAPIRNIESVERDVRRQPESTERLYLFVKDEKTLGSLAEEGEDTKTLFGYLESLFLCDLIDEVRVTVELNDGSKIKFTQLSEGEQQLLTVLGLLLFTQNDESLYLLDEPDTHLNPVWTYDFLKLLQENIRADKGQLLIATHNPLMIGNLSRNQVRILRNSEEKTISIEPEYDPMGVGIEGLLKSELYGLRSTLSAEILKKIDAHYKLLGKKNKTDDDNRKLMKLSSYLNELSISHTHPNPYFELFATTMAKRMPPSKESLSNEELEKQTKLADDVLAEILEEEGNP